MLEWWWVTDLLVSPAEATKTEGNGANGHGEITQDAEKPNAFDKIKADENDEGKTGAKVRCTSSIDIPITANPLPNRRMPMTATRQKTQPTNPTPLPKTPSKKTPPAKKPNPPTSSKRASSTSLRAAASAPTLRTACKTSSAASW
jgi:hypothetical protein